MTARLSHHGFSSYLQDHYLPPNKKVRTSNHLPTGWLVTFVTFCNNNQAVGNQTKNTIPQSVYRIGWLGWVGCQQPGGKQVFGTFDHVALPLDFCFPGFVEPTEGPRKLNQGGFPWDLCCSFLASCFAVFGWGALAGSIENYTRTCQDSIYHL